MTFLKKNKPTNNLNNYIMENTHEFKAVHDPLFCEEGDIPFEVHLVNKDGSKFVTIQEEFYNPKDVPACNPENSCEVIQNFLEDNNVLDYPGQNNELLDSILDYKDYNEYKLKTSFKYKVMKFLKLTK